MRFVHFREQNLLEIDLPQIMYKLIHSLLAARLSEDAHVVYEALHVSDDLQQDDLTAAGDGSAKHKTVMMIG